MGEIEDGPFAVSGFSIGHWTHPTGATGCTVILADRQAPAAVDVRGGAPGTRELALLDEGRLVQRADAVLLTGGSAFGLASADGVMSWLREHGRGFPTRSIPVPIVPGAVIFDLTGDEPVWPGSAAGYGAAMSAKSDGWVSGAHGAGAGATVAKGGGAGRARRSGIGVGRITTPTWTMSAVFVVNAFGDVFDDTTGEPLALPAPVGNELVESTEDILQRAEIAPPFGENTTIGALLCDRPMSREALNRLCVAGHSGLARVIRPSHTIVDGDTVFALAPDLGSVSTSLQLQITSAAQRLSARAVANAIRAVQ